MSDTGAIVAPMIAPEQNRVIVFVNMDSDDPLHDAVNVYAVPASWDADDLDRFVLDRQPHWVSAAVVTVQSVDAEAS